jgi:hypothetical protein
MFSGYQLHELNHPFSRPVVKSKSFKHPPTNTTASKAGLTYRKIKSTETLPENFVWHPNILTAVRDQGQCGSCWAFAISSSIADRIMIKTKGNINVPLSVQHLLNCSLISGGGNPCDGNDVGIALGSLPEDGLIPESIQPYLMINGENQIFPCKLENKSGYSVRYPVEGTYIITGGDLNENILNMKSHIYHEGPIIGVMLNVYPDFSEYDGLSIYEPVPNQKSEGGHAIEILGWGKNKDGVAYWICRNSWGELWPANHLEGMGKGWFYIKLGKNVSGIEELAYAVVPVVFNSDYAPTSNFTDEFKDGTGQNLSPSYTGENSYNYYIETSNPWSKHTNLLIFLLVISAIGALHILNSKYKR